MLEVNNISKMMEIFPVINNVTFSVDDGEMISMCGDPFGGDFVLQAIPGLLQIKRGNVKLDDVIVAGHGMTKKSEEYVGQFSYISTTGTLLWEKSFNYNLKLREKWFKDYNSTRALDALDALVQPKEENFFSGGAGPRHSGVRAGHRNGVEILSGGQYLAQHSGWFGRGEMPGDAGGA